MNFKQENLWALILGGSSGFGLATAKELASRGMNICVVHRDRKGAMVRIEQDFEEIRAQQVNFKAFNLDALSADGINTVLSQLAEVMGTGKIRLLLHSIAFGNLKLVAPQAAKHNLAIQELACKTGIAVDNLQQNIDQLYLAGNDQFAELASPPKYDSELLLEDEDLAGTIFAMGTSLLTWTRAVFKRQLFASDARVLGLTSEGNEIAWLGYAAVSAAKAALEAVSRSIAKEFAPHGIRSNIVQPGVTDTPALRVIPGSAKLMAQAKLKNPFGRLTTVEDVAKVIALLSSTESAWINGSIIRVDGGERISG